MREFFPVSHTWTVSESTAKLNLWWTQPVLHRPWGLLGKVLQYLAGLTILLDLFGEAKIEAIYERAGDARKRTIARIKMIVPTSIRSSRDWFVKLSLLIVPLAYLTTGFSFFWVLTRILHCSLALSVWLTVAGMVIAPVAAAIPIIDEGDRAAWQAFKAFSAVLVIAAAIGLVINGRSQQWVVVYGTYALLAAGFAVALAVYSFFIGTIFLLLSVAELVLLTIFFTSARLARLAFWKKAHPLRWLAFFIFTVGFFLDLLAS
jgi:hypothetical protein